MRRIFLGLGSNLDDRMGYLRAAVARLRDTDCLSVERCSSVYETSPVGKTDQGHFLNAVVDCRSNCDPRNLVPVLKEIERSLGRRHRGRWEPREIDIDLLFCGDLVITSREVIVPHPELRRRRFVLEPLTELAPLFPDPMRGARVVDLLHACGGSEQVKRILDTL